MLETAATICFASTMTAPSKHVIFLGAGASAGSGYPLANELRLRISSRAHWEKDLKDCQSSNEQIVGSGLGFWAKHEGILTLFRNGGFATLDEFCNLARPSRFQGEIHKLRRVVRAMLGIFNPEDHFESSEYYSFVQGLFKDDLFSLRDDISVLTYNYDPYLEFLLYRALDVRKSIRTEGNVTCDHAQENEHSLKLNAVTSGFYTPTDLRWLTTDKEKAAFCVLQLHGSICFPKCLYIDRPDVDYKTLFEATTSERAAVLFQEETPVPPIVFPWEIMREGRLADHNSFPFPTDRTVMCLFQGMWARARREVQAAKKISFVGLSMHPFLLDGLKYLFDGKQDKVEVVIANPENTAFDRRRTETHWQRNPNSPGSILSQVLSTVAPKMQRFGIMPHGSAGQGDLTLVKDFTEFIRTQMAPVTDT